MNKYLLLGMLFFVEIIFASGQEELMGLQPPQSRQELKTPSILKERARYSKTLEEEQILEALQSHEAHVAKMPASEQELYWEDYMRQAQEYFADDEKKLNERTLAKLAPFWAGEYSKLKVTQPSENKKPVKFSESVGQRLEFAPDNVASWSLTNAKKITEKNIHDLQDTQIEKLLKSPIKDFLPKALRHFTNEQSKALNARILDYMRSHASFANLGIEFLFNNYKLLQNLSYEEYKKLDFNGINIEFLKDLSPESVTIILGRQRILKRLTSEQQKALNLDDLDVRLCKFLFEETYKTSPILWPLFIFNKLPEVAIMYLLETPAVLNRLSSEQIKALDYQRITPELFKTLSGDLFNQWPVEVFQKLSAQNVTVLLEKPYVLLSLTTEQLDALDFKDIQPDVFKNLSTDIFELLPVAIFKKFPVYAFKELSEANIKILLEESDILPDLSTEQIQAINPEIFSKLSPMQIQKNLSPIISKLSTAQRSRLSFGERSGLSVPVQQLKPIWWSQPAAKN